MTSDLRQPIDLFLRRTTLHLGAIAAVRGLLRASPLALGIAMLSALDRFLVFPIWVRQSMWFALLVGGLALLASAFFPLRMFTTKQKSRISNAALSPVAKQRCDRMIVK